MKKLSKLLFACALSCLLLSFITGNKDFTGLLARAKMTFDKPDSLIEADIIENRQMNYEFALSYPGGHFETRYAIRPLDSMLARYRKDTAQKRPGSFYVNPNKLYKASFQAILLNVFGGKLPGIKVFKPADVKNEFGADWGAIAGAPVSGAFGKGYRFCSVVAIHKDNAGDAYYFYLADSTVTRQEYGKLMLPLFHTLRFR